jgi:hypothetical protein
MSGGSTGPEGSIVMLPTLLLAAIVIYSTCQSVTAGANLSTVPADRSSGQEVGLSG